MFSDNGRNLAGVLLFQETTVTETPMRDAARDYFKLGYSVIPIRPNEKRPALTSWAPSQHKAWGLREINEWWTANPEHNIGIVTGKISMISVVDVDGDEGKKALVNAGVKFPETRIHKTPHGWHLIFAYDKAFKQGQGLLDHVDIRNDGGYIVAPPSTVDGKEYVLHADKPPAQITVPPVLQRQALDEAQTKARGKEQTLRPQWVSQLLANPPSEPGRNQAATRIAGYFHRQGIPADVITEILTPWAQQCTPPFTELSDVVSSITRYDNTLFHIGEIIPEPEVHVFQSGRMKFDWELDRLVFDLERIRINSAAIPCLITIERNGEHFYGPASFDLLSSSQRRTLRGDIGGEVPWGGYFSWIAKRVREEYDRPYSVIDLGAHEIQRDSPWAIEPLLRRGLPTLMFGSGGVGKSTLALALCLSLASGKSIIPGLRVPEATNALYLDWEQETDDAAGVLNGIASAAGIPATGVWHMRMSGALTDHLDHAITFMREHEIGFVVVDSILPASGNDIKDDEAPRLFYEAIRETGATALCLTHHSKAEPDQPYGNIYWTNLARATWKVEGEQEPESDTLHIELFNMKQNRGKRAKPIGLDAVFDDAGIAYREAEITSESRVGIANTLSDRIFGLLLDAGGLTSRDIADHFGKTSDGIIHTLRSGEGKRFVKLDSTRPARWGAVTHSIDSNNSHLLNNNSGSIDSTPPIRIGEGGAFNERDPKDGASPVYGDLPWDK
jgi:hypothetical protein